MAAERSAHRCSPPAQRTQTPIWYSVSEVRSIRVCAAGVAVEDAGHGLAGGREVAHDDLLAPHHLLAAPGDGEFGGAWPRAVRRRVRLRGGQLSDGGGRVGVRLGIWRRSLTTADVERRAVRLAGGRAHHAQGGRAEGLGVDAGGVDGLEVPHAAAGEPRSCGPCGQVEPQGLLAHHPARSIAQREGVDDAGDVGAVPT